MQPSDFLHKDAETELREQYIAGGAMCSLSTNSPAVIEAARNTFQRVELPPSMVDFRLRFWVHGTDRSQPPWPKPYVRGLNALVFAGFDERSSMLADLRTRRIIGRFSAGMAADLTYWQTVIFPMLLTIVSASVGIAELHCACVAKNGKGVLLAGPSGTGKSTLALALSQKGFGFLSDDRTFCSMLNDELWGWGLPTPLKLRPEAAVWFDQLREKHVTNTRSGGPAFWLAAEELRGVERVRDCRPVSLIFLERRDTTEFRMTPMPSAEALSRLNRELMMELPDAADKRSKIINKIVELPSWLLQYGGPPEPVARQIANHLAKV